MSRRLAWTIVGSAIAVGVFHMALYGLPTNLGVLIFGPLGKVSRFVSRLMRDRGTHGLGPSNPVVDLAVIYAFAALLGGGVAWLLTRPRRTPDKKARVLRDE
jgi:hypothetical protein